MCHGLAHTVADLFTNLFYYILAEKGEEAAAAWKKEVDRVVRSWSPGWELSWKVAKIAHDSPPAPSAPKLTLLTAKGDIVEDAANHLISKIWVLLSLFRTGGGECDNGAEVYRKVAAEAKLLWIGFFNSIKVSHHHTFDHLWIVWPYFGPKAVIKLSEEALEGAHKLTYTAWLDHSTQTVPNPRREGEACGLQDLMRYSLLHWVFFGFGLLREGWTGILASKVRGPRAARVNPNVGA